MKLKFDSNQQNILDEEIIQYYSDMDFSLWEKSLNLYFNKLKKLKNEKLKRVWSLKLYSTYLQLLEVFCLNVFAITENNLWGNLFLDNYKMRNKIQEQFNSEFIEYFITNWVFGINEKNSIKDFNNKKTLYKLIIKEFVSDYLKDYELLNAYKHGFRIKSIGEKNISVEGGEPNKRNISIVGLNSTISYLCKKKDNIIYRNDISFNWQRIIAKSFFIINMLENTKQILLSNGKVIKINTINIFEKKIFDKSFGNFRVSIPIIQLKTK